MTLAREPSDGECRVQVGVLLENTFEFVGAVLEQEAGASNDAVRGHAVREDGKALGFGVLRERAHMWLRCPTSEWIAWRMPPNPARSPRTRWVTTVSGGGCAER